MDIKIPKNALKSHVDAEDKTRWRITTQFGDKDATIINESGLYSLILSSKLPNAKKFSRWVTSEVLPSIRKNGAYINGQESMTEMEIMARAILSAQKIIESKDIQIAEMKPKALFADSVCDSEDTILVRDLAKILRQNGFDIGCQRLYAWLRENKYLIKKRGADYNMPTQRSMDMGLFWIHERVYEDEFGEQRLTRTAKVTGKGQKYFVNVFIKKRDAA